ncbi:insulin-like growth factor-binding protein complex acid labile subunit [Phycodurus eques]|uniref:insulin-like growth factor-binding protein complex acid labile subunit n=1 Tax=Phycodurus eques TaxID=693459 RepID=UPI002ACE949A|nr:insulin-like growth factor-binding protein complex acid labile subunit [Phycodurus eques]
MASANQCRTVRIIIIIIWSLQLSGSVLLEYFLQQDGVILQGKCHSADSESRRGEAQHVTTVLPLLYSSESSPSLQGSMCRPRPVFLLLFLAFCSPPFFSPPAACSRLCPRRCLCYEHTDLVDCRDRGLEHVPRGLPRGTWLLELGGNNLSEICTRVFTGLRSLRVLALADSRIRALRPQAFFSLSYLEKLDLSGNRLTSLPADFSVSLSALRELRLEHNNLHRLSAFSFEHLDNIEKLDLSHNHLVLVGPGVFRGLSRLRQLDMHSNRLSTVQQGSLDMLPALEVLQLSHNNISQIDTKALAPLYSLAVLALEGNNLRHLKFKTFLSLHTTATHIRLAGNPWSCDCELHRVFSKILHVRHLHVDDYRNVTCRQPPQLAGASLARVDSQLCVAETATVLVITVTALVTVAAAVVMAERNRKRNRGKNWDTESQNHTNGPPS